MSNTMIPNRVRSGVKGAVPVMKAQAQPVGVKPSISNAAPTALSSNQVRIVPREVARPVASRPTGPRPASSTKRQQILSGAVALIVGVFGIRLVQLQVFQAPKLAAEALDGRMVTTALPAHRGQIVDRNGVVLATSVDRYQLNADPKAILGFKGNGRLDADGNPVANGALGVAQLLAPLISADPMELAAKLNGENQYVVIAKDLEPTLQRQIAELDLKSYLYTEVLPKRIYPAGPIAGTLLGFTDVDQVGQGGLERAYNEVLAGTDGSKSYERGANGLQIPGGEYTEVPPVNGGDVVLTIDADVQWKAQQVIDETVQKFGAEHGMIIVQNIRTGELWAVADAGGVDPNDRSDERIARGSRAVQDTFEPGSTGKIITMAAALETGVVTPTSEFTVPYLYHTPNGMPFHDSKDHPVWQLTATGILAKSSNTGTVQIAENIPREVQYEYLQKFHLGEYTGLNLPGESRGKIHPYEKWDGRTRYTVSFGQGLTVNAIQATEVYSTVANGGIYTPPSLVRGVRDAESSSVQAFEAPVTSQVIAPETAATLMKMLEQATADDGTAKAAKIPAFRVAGKTGTAELIMPDRTTIMASFIGVAPADNPEFVVAVFVNAPQWGVYGGTVAAPAFREVMGFVLQQQGVAPSVPEQNPLPIYWGDASAH